MHSNITADTGQLGRLIELCGNAIKLMRSKSRSPKQVEKVISALQEFKDAKKYNAPNEKYPGCFGNRCKGCGGYIDDGGVCPCGWDHNSFQKI